MNGVRPGDIIFSYVGGRIVAVAVAQTAAYDSPRPGGMGEGLWEDDGKRIDVDYRDLAPGLPIAVLLPEIQPLLPDKYSPLNRNGTGNQGYLFPVPPRVGRLLLDRVDDEQAEALDEGFSHSTRDKTERRALIQSRIGQGDFREGLMKLWGGRCAVTGLDLPVLLRASHIKPWRDSDNRERLDPYNGLLLAPAYDATFDAGVISFRDDGEVILSDRLSPTRLLALGVSSEARIAGLQAKHRAYLEHHRQEVLLREARQTSS
jgi:hypothetical protein